MISFD